MEETSGDHQVQSPAQGTIRQQLAQGSVEMGFDCLKAWKLHRLSIAARVHFSLHLFGISLSLSVCCLSSYPGACFCTLPFSG